MWIYYDGLCWNVNYNQNVFFLFILAVDRHYILCLNKLIGFVECVLEKSHTKICMFSTMEERSKSTAHTSKLPVTEYKLPITEYK